MYFFVIFLLLVVVVVSIGFTDLLLIVLGLTAALGVVSLLLWKGNVIVPLVVMALVIIFFIDLCLSCF